MNKKKLLKSIRSLEKKEKEHLEKIREEKIKNPENPVLGYWDKELKHFAKEIKKNKEKLTKKRK